MSLHDFDNRLPPNLRPGKKGRSINFLERELSITLELGDLFVVDYLRLKERVREEHLIRRIHSDGTLVSLSWYESGVGETVFQPQRYAKVPEYQNVSIQRIDRDDRLYKTSLMQIEGSLVSQRLEYLRLAKQKEIDLKYLKGLE